MTCDLSLKFLEIRNYFAVLKRFCIYLAGLVRRNVIICRAGSLGGGGIAHAP